MKNTDTKVEKKEMTPSKKNETAGFIRKVDKQLNMAYIIEWILNGYLKDTTRPVFSIQCPFCGGVNFSLKIDNHKKTFKCADCGITGGPVLFVMLLEKQSLREALQSIADRFDIDISVIPIHVLIHQV
jgi:DNA primase